MLQGRIAQSINLCVACAAPTVLAPLALLLVHLELRFRPTDNYKSINVKYGVNESSAVGGHALG